MTTPILLAKDLARVANPEAKKFQVERQIGPDLRVRVYCVRGGIQDDAANRRAS